MASRCTPARAKATLTFEIAGYSLRKGMGRGKSVRSAPVSVGGYNWCIGCCPDVGTGETNDYLTVFLMLLSNPAEPRALYDLRLVNKASGLSSSVVSCLESPMVFNCDHNPIALEAIERSRLEGSRLLQDDCLVIECDLTVFKEPLIVDESAGLQMPPSNLSENLGNLLKTGEEADVTFEIEGEIFPVHKIVLAMRSPVFKAQLYGPMRDKTIQKITVEDMQPAVFSAFLHFIYTDLLPSMEDLDDDEKKEMVKHLLVAADRSS
ncbi:hypothetical protein QYE76_047039 [Lolium multiflorum]|uniref:Uncharacterized protein n=1 Tax=Lolium multiflorum TaxID=4521 RepID=A0AAD8X188_LOLMU|nr:hypothetical protein QYE76_047039 [Lolium multiflorum]